jgi:hypothetical protein
LVAGCFWASWFTMAETGLKGEHDSEKPISVQSALRGGSLRPYDRGGEEPHQRGLQSAAVNDIPGSCLQFPLEINRFRPGPVGLGGM